MQLQTLVLTPQNEYKIEKYGYSSVAINKNFVDRNTDNIFMACFFMDGALASKIDPQYVDNLYKIATELGMQITLFAGKYCTDKKI
jgi:hypothetical protein